MTLPSAPQTCGTCEYGRFVGDTRRCILGNCTWEAPHEWNFPLGAFVQLAQRVWSNWTACPCHQAKDGGK